MQLIALYVFYSYGHFHIQLPCVVMGMPRCRQTPAASFASLVAMEMDWSLELHRFVGARAVGTAPVLTAPLAPSPGQTMVQVAGLGTRCAAVPRVRGKWIATPRV